MKLFFILNLIFSIFLSVNSFAQTPVNPPANTKKIIMLGDSLTEGLGVAKSSAYPALIEQKIKNDQKNWVVVNAGISGSTSASGPSRMKWQLKSKPNMVFLALGANDGLRGFKVSEIEKNLSESIEMAQKEKVTVVLGGMMMPPNYGDQYAKDFAALYPRLAKKYNLTLVPFILKGVAGDPALNLADGVHPNEKGYIIVADTIYSVLKGLL